MPLSREEFHDRLTGVESSGDPLAIGPPVETGHGVERARGLYQTLPSTLGSPGLGVAPAENPDDPKEQARVGEQYLDALVRRYDGDQVAASMAFNWGFGNYDKWVRNGSPQDQIPDETRAYVGKIFGDRQIPSPTPTSSDVPTQGSTIARVGANASPGAVQEASGAYALNVNGIPFDVSFPGSREQAMAQLATVLQENPNLLAEQASKKGLKFDPETQTGSKYGALERFRLGVGREAATVISGAKVATNLLVGNVEAADRERAKSVEEGKAWDLINTPGIVEAQDLGAIALTLPMMFGPTGILRALGTGASALGLEEFFSSLGEGEATAGEALTSGAAASALAVAGVKGVDVGKWALSAWINKAGSAGLGAWGAAGLTDLIATGGLSTGALAVGRLLSKARSAFGVVTKAHAKSGRIGLGTGGGIGGGSSIRAIGGTAPSPKFQAAVAALKVVENAANSKAGRVILSHHAEAVRRGSTGAAQALQGAMAKQVEVEAAKVVASTTAKRQAAQAAARLKILRAQRDAAAKAVEPARVTPKPRVRIKPQESS